MCTHKHTSIDWISTVGKKEHSCKQLTVLRQSCFHELVCDTKAASREQSQLAWAWWEAAGYTIMFHFN